MIRLKNLVESLETKYALTEALSDDMPDWFAKRLLTTKYTPTSEPSKRDLGGSAHYKGVGSRSRIGTPANQKKNPQAGKMPEYKNHEWYDGDQSLYTKMLDAGISLDTVKIIEGPVPLNTNDKRLQPPNIPVFLLTDGIVYVKGYNDEEKLGSRKTLGAYDLDKILEKCEKFAYIDGDDPENFKRTEKRNARAYRDSSAGRIGKYFDREGNDLFRSRSWSSSFDKSGYEIIPTVDKYKDKLDEIKAGKIYDTLKYYEDYLNDANQEIANYVSETMMASTTGSSKEERTSSYDRTRSARRMLDYFDTCIEYYNSAIETVDQIFSESSYSDEQKRQAIVQQVINGWIPSLDNYIKRFEQYTEDFNSTIDWI